MTTFPELSGKVVVISGAGGNLGQAAIRRFADEGAKLALIDRKGDVLREWLKSQHIDSTGVLIGPVDLTKKAEVDSFIDKVVAQFGQVDVVINIAGGFKAGQPVHETDEETWSFMLDINLKTTILLSGAAVRQMLAKGNIGRVINVGSQASLKGGANGAAYAASKGALLRVTESMAAELLSKDITVNAILPSTIDTPQNRAAMPKADFSKWVQADSLAAVMVFLASDSAKDISGAAIPVYGKA